MPVLRQLPSPSSPAFLFPSTQEVLGQSLWGDSGDEWEDTLLPSLTASHRQPSPVPPSFNRSHSQIFLTPHFPMASRSPESLSFQMGPPSLTPSSSDTLSLFFLA